MSTYRTSLRFVPFLANFFCYSEYRKIIMEKYARFEVLRAVVMRNQVFWDIMPRRLITSLLYVLRSFDTAVPCNSQQCHIPKDLNLHGTTRSGSAQSKQRCNNSQPTAVIAIFLPLNKPQPLPLHVVQTDHNKNLLILLATNI